MAEVDAKSLGAIITVAGKLNAATVYLSADDMFLNIAFPFHDKGRFFCRLPNIGEPLSGHYVHGADFVSIVPKGYNTTLSATGTGLRIESDDGSMSTVSATEKHQPFEIPEPDETLSNPVASQTLVNAGKLAKNTAARASDQVGTLRADIAYVHCDEQVSVLATNRLTYLCADLGAALGSSTFGVVPDHLIACASIPDQAKLARFDGSHGLVWDDGVAIFPPLNESAEDIIFLHDNLSVPHTGVCEVKKSALTKALRESATKGASYENVKIAGVKGKKQITIARVIAQTEQTRTVIDATVLESFEFVIPLEHFARMARAATATSLTLMHTDTLVAIANPLFTLACAKVEEAAA